MEKEQETNDHTYTMEKELSIKWSYIYNGKRVK